MAQAEHAPGSSILITWDAPLRGGGRSGPQTAHLERGDLARQSLEEFGAVILVRDAAEACALANEIAPEHLHIAATNAEPLLEQDPSRGGRIWAIIPPWPLGDYAAGPSHVLPTGGTARFASG